MKTSDKIAYFLNKKGLIGENNRIKLADVANILGIKSNTALIAIKNDDRIVSKTYRFENTRATFIWLNNRLSDFNLFGETMIGTLDKYISATPHVKELVNSFKDAKIGADLHQWNPDKANLIISSLEVSENCVIINKIDTEILETFNSINPPSHQFKDEEIANINAKIIGFFLQKGYHFPENQVPENHNQIILIK